MNFDLNEKVIFLNDIVGGTLGITHYTEWELSSYEENSLFSHGGLVGRVYAKNFAECIDKATKLTMGVIING